MTDFVQQITSLSWWLGVVIVGIAINLFSAFIKPRLDAFAGILSERIREKNNEKKVAWKKDVHRLSVDNIYRETFSSKVSIEYLESIFLVLMGVSLFLIGSAIGTTVPTIEFQFLSEKFWVLSRLFVFLVGSISMLIGMINHTTASRMVRKLSEASREAADDNR